MMMRRMMMMMMTVAPMSGMKAVPTSSARLPAGGAIPGLALDLKLGRFGVWVDFGW